jgi:hypothetical protein
MAYDSQRTPALPWQIAQSRAPNLRVRVGAAAGCGLQCYLGQAVELFFAMARRTASLGIFSTRNGPAKFSQKQPHAK